MSYFQDDLKIGKRGEQLVAAALAARGHQVTDVSDNPQYQREDIDFTLAHNGQFATLEVKNDLRSEDTGNVFIETFCITNRSRNGDGWFYYCTADFLAFVQENKQLAHIVSRADLINLIDTHDYRKGGKYDRSTVGWLVPLADLATCGTYTCLDLKGEM